MDAGVVALMIPIAAIISGALVKMAKIRAAAGGDGMADDLRNRLEAMEHEQAELRRELSEAQERPDFTERLLTQHQDKPLPPLQ